MYVIVQHCVSNPRVFWNIIRDATPQLPAGLRIIQVLPAMDGSVGICLWEARSVDSVRAIVEAAVGHLSRNEYFAVDCGRAIGLSC
jgi:hypothetical protein